MEQLYVEQILMATKGTLISGSKSERVSNISTNSKEVKASGLFVPIKGERFDGHDFIDDAIENGAKAFLKEKSNGYDYRKNHNDKEIICIEVEDTLKAYQDIATHYRNYFYIPIIGITGSVGKTSTKEMISDVLSKGFKVLKTSGNLNGQLGVPATILNLDDTDDIAVIEMGISKFHEMDRLSEIAKIDHAVITNVGVTHIENLLTKDNILSEKLKITNGFNKNNTLFANFDNESLREKSKELNCDIVSFGIDSDCDYKARNIKYENGMTTFDIDIYDMPQTIEILSIGRYNIYNALAAIAIGCKFGLSVDNIKAGILSYKNPPMRQNIYVRDGINIIDDTYNSNPDSMKSSIDVLCEIAGDNRKIVVSADMLELGEQSRDLHLEIGQYMNDKDIDVLITCGEESKYTCDGFDKEKYHFDNHEELNEKLKSVLRPNDFLLVKGSRGMHMEDVVNYLINKEN